MRHLTRALVALLIASVLLAVPAAGQAAPRRDRVEPYVGLLGGDGWPVYWGRAAIPICIVNAESHGLVHEHSHPWGSSGKYQIEPETWKAFGGRRYAHLAYEATELEQSIIAAKIWNHGHGASNWTTAAGCGW